MIDFSDYDLGQSTDGAINISTRQENADAALELVSQTRQKISIISTELDPFVYDQPEFVEALRKVVIGNRYAEVRVIVFEAALISRRGHKILDLAGKLSSFIELRKASNEYRSFNEAVMIVDEVGYLFRENRERYKGKVNFNSRRESKALLEVFNAMWETATPDPNLRRVLI